VKPTKTKETIMTITTTPSLSTAIARRPSSSGRPVPALKATVRASAPKAKSTQLSARAYAERALQEYLRNVQRHDMTPSIDWEA
jgi:hypothetical protein